MERRAAALPQRKVFREEVLNAIRDAIFAGELNPGDKIIETFWAKELGVSQGPVREAIRDLEALGLVETIRDAIGQLPEQGLESLVRRLREILEEMDGFAGQGDLRHFTECDAAFHRAIIDATGNLVLRRLWEQCNMRNWFSVSALTDAESLKQLQRGHQRLLEQIAVRDERAAVSTIEDHLTSLMDGFIRGVQP